MRICLECFELFDPQFLTKESVFEYQPCPLKRCDGHVIHLDELIAPTIILLNQKGYYTLFCCGGHWYENYVSPYIMFEPNCLPPSLPKAFIWDDNTIRYRGTPIHDKPLPVKFKKITKINQDLLEWAEALEEVEE